MLSNLVNVIALCDVDTKSLDAAKATIVETGPTLKLGAIKLYSDYWILLAGEKSLDVVIIATPDHLENRKTGQPQKVSLDIRLANKQQ